MIHGQTLKCTSVVNIPFPQQTLLHILKTDTHSSRLSGSFVFSNRQLQRNYTSNVSMSVNIKPVAKDNIADNFI